MSDDIALLKRRFEREKKARKEAEFLLEMKSRALYDSNQTLSNLALNLEDLVNSRTQALEEAVEQAVNANRSKSEFLSNMSHELRTPLNAIIGFSEFLLTDPIDKLSVDQKDSVDEIHNAGKHLLILINEILDLSKIEAGKSDIDCKDTDIAPIVMESIALVTPLAQKENIDFRLSCNPKSSFMVHIDSLRLKQVILNLMSNAIKYNKENGYILLHQGEIINEKYLRIVIEDSGIGIAKEDMSRVFEVFQRVGKKKTIVEGAGVGLPLSKKIMNSMGGDLGFSSIENEGSQFWIDIPLAKGINDLFQFSDEFSEEKIEILESNIKILYIEDNETNIKLVTSLLKRKAYQLLIAHNAEDGLKIMRDKKPALVLMDIDLPKMNGFDALKVIRNDVDLKSTIVIGLSANAMTGDIEKAMSAGFDDYVTKPIDIDLLLSVITESVSHL